jgi:hypothetical protein
MPRLGEPVLDPFLLTGLREGVDAIDPGLTK